MRQRTQLNGIWLAIYKEEWKRAKSIIRFTVRRPSTRWQSRMRNVHATYWHYGNRITFNENYQQPDFVGSTYETEFRGTIRHEFAHIHTTGHGRDFQVNLQRLGGDRHATIDLPPLQQQPKVIVYKPKINIIAARYQNARRKLKQAETRVKRAETFKEKWALKVHYYEKHHLNKLS